jgi:hypothetical protein
LLGLAHISVVGIAGLHGGFSDCRRKYAAARRKASGVVALLEMSTTSPPSISI